MAPLVDVASGALYARCVPNTSLHSKNASSTPRIAIVVPYPPKQASVVLDALRQWLGKAVVCSAAPVPTDLFLLCSRDPASCLTEKAVQNVLDPYRNASFGPEMVFPQVRLRFANLSAREDGYYYSIWRRRHVSWGTANLFYPLFSRAEEVRAAGNSTEYFHHPLGLAQDYDYFLWLEPDAYALHPCFLQMLHRQVANRHPFWVMGSAPMYRRRHGWVVWPHDHHINGNAVYRLGDDCFTEGALRRVASTFPAEPFDSALQRWRMAVSQDAWWRVYAHLFIYTDWIQNYGDRAWCPALVRAKSPFTAIVHGRQRWTAETEDCLTRISGTRKRGAFA